VGEAPHVADGVLGLAAQFGQQRVGRRVVGQALPGRLDAEG
jgi:hypothetical protein